MLRDCNSIRRIIRALSPSAAAALIPLEKEIISHATEIRLRGGRPLCVCFSDRMSFVKPDGCFCRSPDNALILTPGDISLSLQGLCAHSVYNRQHEINSGFIKLPSGHRAGISGTAVLNSGELINVRDVSSINIRLAREFKGCASKLYTPGERFQGMLICGEPSSGKTTVLRELARILSTDGQMTVSVIDERGELAASVGGMPQLDIGLSDVYDGYPKAAAVSQALRSMAPEVIICDELGDSSDIKAITGCVNSGVAVAASVHAGSYKELVSKPVIKELLSLGAFTKFVFLKGRRFPGEIDCVREAGDSLDA